MATTSFTSAKTAADFAQKAASFNPILGILAGIGTILFGAAAVCREVPKIIESASNASKNKDD